MGLTRAQRLARQTTLTPWEVSRGKVVHLPPEPLRSRPAAARLTLLVEDAAAAAGAWVSTEALVRVSRRPETALRPVLAVIDGDPPYDGVIDGVPLLVIDVGVQPGRRWTAGAARTLWSVQPDGVVVVGDDATTLVESGGVLRAAALPTLRMPVATLCQMAGYERVRPLTAPVARH